MTTTLFLHGLDSSSQGTKGRYFKKYFPDVLCPDFSGDLAQRLDQLKKICAPYEKMTLIGSSFGGLMATIFAIRQPTRVGRLFLLAPALNFEQFTPPASPIITPTLLIKGKNDTVCPPDLVRPLAEKTFTDLEVRCGDDDHLLREMFLEIDWQDQLADSRS